MFFLKYELTITNGKWGPNLGSASYKSFFDEPFDALRRWLSVALCALSFSNLHSALFLNGFKKIKSYMNQDTHQDLYSYRLIGKLTAFLQLQEFSLRNTTVDSSTPAPAARLTLPS
jgi:hypothetical protein